MKVWDQANFSSIHMKIIWTGSRADIRSYLWQVSGITLKEFLTFSGDPSIVLKGVVKKMNKRIKVFATFPVNVCFCCFTWPRQRNNDPPIQLTVTPFETNMNLLLMKPVISTKTYGNPKQECLLLYNSVDRFRERADRKNKKGCSQVTLDLLAILVQKQRG